MIWFIMCYNYTMIYYTIIDLWLIMIIIWFIIWHYYILYSYELYEIIWLWTAKKSRSGGQHSDEREADGEPAPSSDDFEICTEAELNVIYQRTGSLRDGARSRPPFSSATAAAPPEDSNPLDVIRRESEHRLQNIYLDIFDILSSTKAQLQLTDLIMEDSIPDFG